MGRWAEPPCPQPPCPQILPVLPSAAPSAPAAAPGGAPELSHLEVMDPRLGFLSAALGSEPRSGAAVCLSYHFFPLFFVFSFTEKIIQMNIQFYSFELKTQPFDSVKCLSLK